MAFRRALVVDDSKTARQSLARLLADYELEVAFAESGEAALEFLHHELVDVIFMDHTMPGMDGLEAVSAIKSNPRTATIPVMMYTTREGEVYVSQARALGAVGVLPKQFNPNVLFDMLQKLGLVTDRRSPQTEPPPDAPKRRITDLADEVDQEYERRAMGVSVQTLMTRILEEQHLKLRSEILSEQRRFAHQVAQEILQRHPPEHGERWDADPSTVARRCRWLTAIAAVLAISVGVLGAFAWHLQGQVDAAALEISRMNTASRNEIELLAGRSDGLNSALRESTTAARERQRAAIEALAWALNDDARVPFDELPFGDAAAERIGMLVERLDAMAFAGTVTITARLAPFCLDPDPSGYLRLALPDQAVDDCAIIGHPLTDGGALASWQTVAFAAALDEAGHHPNIRVRLTRYQRLAEDAAGFPGNADTAGAWNRIAAERNRLTYGLEPRPGAALGGNALLGANAPARQ